ncbi:hypothetical protein BDM02DRAFT_3166452 [Thelephora ganbajun]|uniref:Uncharacterized protein n=1 Tax=Thelephora ganbajun TaxID=370292 RepID=A0ACB6ZIQ1_THEGA|nr:hypothetical protein BDM02DRAFT_3166452 [Thelephora ganbajun]
MGTSPTTTRLSSKAEDLPIKSVTVFRPSGAQIVRILKANLKAGNNLLEITGLSSTTDAESLRVTGLGNARLLVLVCNYDNYPDISDSDPIRAAQKELATLRTEVDTRVQQLELLSSYGKSLADKKNVTPDDATTFASQLVKKTIENKQAIKDLEGKIEVLSRRIERTQQEKRGTAQSKASVTIVAEEDGPVELHVSYRVSNAQWYPVYDLHAGSENGKPSTAVSLQYRVALSQSTGEIWNNTDLILSTSATDVLNAGIPTSQSLSIEPIPKQQPTPSYKTRGAAPVIVQAPQVLGTLSYVAAPRGIVSKSPLSVTYAVEGKTTIPTDGQSHKVLVASPPLEATVTHVTTPRKSTIVYLQCAVKNTSDYHLLPGTVNVFLDGSYVSKTDISDINTGDTFQCTLGIDTSTRVVHTLVSSSTTSAASSFVEQYKTTTYTSTTTITNRHTGDYPIRIVERSSLPFASAQDTRIKVFLKQPEGLAEGEEGKDIDLGRPDGFKVKWGTNVDEAKDGKKSGKFIWYGTVDPGKEVILVSQWEVRAPVDVEWTEKSS